jgi:hypothetical protein
VERTWWYEFSELGVRVELVVASRHLYSFLRDLLAAWKSVCRMSDIEQADIVWPSWLLARMVRINIFLQV